MNKIKKVAAKKLNVFLTKVVDSLGALKTVEYWPLNPSQLLAYFDVDLLIDFYNQFNHLKNQGRSPKAILKMFDNRVLGLIDFLINFACVGFKVAHKFNLLKIGFKQREDFFYDIFEIIEAQAPSFFDPKNERRLLGGKEITNLSKNSFLPVTQSNRGVINRFKTAMFGLNWAYYYDVFASLGSAWHGPYSFNYKGKKMMLTVDEYYNQKPTAIWPRAKNSPLETVTIYSLFEPFDLRVNLFGRAKTTESIGQKLKFVRVIIDGKVVRRLENLAGLTEQLLKLSTAQFDYVESLTDLQKVQKAIDFNYYAYRNFFGKNWKIFALKTSKNIRRFGTRFIKNYSSTLSDCSLSRKKIIFDPRNNIF